MATVQDVQLLLDGLTSGADQPIWAVDDWAPYLTPGSLTETFMSQLRTEWHPAVPPDPFSVKITSEVYAYVAANPSGWRHLWGHIVRVTGNALVIAPEAGVEPKYAYLLAILHDIGKLDEIHSGVAHELIGGLMARRLLDPYPDECPPDISVRISRTIAKNNANGDPFVRILHDADKLDKIGATGIMRRLTTDFGARHERQALRQVTLELEDFPAMNFPTSIHLAASKQRFTEQFIEQVRAVMSWL